MRSEAPEPPDLFYVHPGEPGRGNSSWFTRVNKCLVRRLRSLRTHPKFTRVHPDGDACPGSPRWTNIQLKIFMLKLRYSASRQPVWPTNKYKILFQLNTIIKFSKIWARLQAPQEAYKNKVTFLFFWYFSIGFKILYSSKLFQWQARIPNRNKTCYQNSLKFSMNTVNKSSFKLFFS